ncbi:MAG TPA: glycosyltransferase family 2 protein [Dissulfurispiraceae bacterium]|nr:glycosyltransferase family 2 protein [Dissulfurispiraceae bacterium]
MVSVIVVDYGKDKLQGCLDSLKTQIYQDFETIVVDNNEINRGFAGGVNEGIRRAKGEYIALLNNDARADKKWLAALMLSARTNNAGMVASKVLRPDGKIESAGCVLYPDGNGMCRGRGASQDDTRYNSRGVIGGFPSGCAALYKRSMLDQIGLFDETFFMYNEDTEMGIRARRAGYACVYDPRAVVYHHGSKNTLRKLYYVERNRIRIMMRHFTFWLLVKSIPWTLLRYARGGR